MKTPDELAPPTIAQEVEFRVCFAIGAAVVAVATLFRRAAALADAVRHQCIAASKNDMAVMTKSPAQNVSTTVQNTTFHEGWKGAPGDALDALRCSARTTDRSVG